jgi:hypothetical protein
MRSCKVFRQFFVFEIFKRSSLLATGEGDRQALQKKKEKNLKQNQNHTAPWIPARSPITVLTWRFEA